VFVLAQLLVGVLAAILLLSGVTLLVMGVTPLLGITLTVIGLVGLAVLLVERMRYRSDRADRAATPGWSPGGEPADEPLEPRFRPTEERFVDPTTGRTMRVYLDSETGERRYLPEG
jgi:hypothetical protein